jgi:hypothetical protein
MVEAAPEFSVKMGSAYPNLRNMKLNTIGGETIGLGETRTSHELEAKRL